MNLKSISKHFWIFSALPELPLRKILLFHLISWCENFVESHSLRIVLGDSPETIRKLCLSTKFFGQEIRWNNGILRSVLLLKLK